MASPRNVRIASAIVLAMVLGAGAFAKRADQNNADAGSKLPPETIAVVDMEHLYIVSGARDLVEQKEYIEVRAEALQKLESITSAPFLTLQERQEYVELLGTTKPTDAQQARITALKTLSDQRDADLRQLGQKPEAQLTPDEKTRVRELTDERRTLEQILPGIQESLARRQNERLDALRREQLANLRAAVAQVAKEKGIAHVFDSSALVYSTTDLTALVAQKLGKHLPNVSGKGQK